MRIIFAIIAPWAILLASSAEAHAEDVPSVVSKLAEAVKEQRRYAQMALKNAKYKTRDKLKAELSQIDRGDFMIPDVDLLSPRVGKFGKLPKGTGLRIKQIVDGSTMHVVPERGSQEGERTIVRGISTKDMADGQLIGTEALLEIVGTERYDTVIGSIATCFVVKAVSLEKWKPKVMELAGLKPK